MLTIGVLALTSAGACAFGVGYLKLSSSHLAPAVGKMLEFVGTSLLFLCLNVAVIAGIAFAARVLSASFISAYGAGDVALIGFSLCQAAVFQWWRQPAQLNALQRLSA